MTTTILSITDLNTTINHEPRVLDIRLGEVLGMSRPRDIRQLIERNRVELERYGSLAVRRRKSRGQEFNEFWLTEGQALCLAALSTAPKAPEARQMLIEVFMEWRRGQARPQPSADALTLLAARLLVAQQSGTDRLLVSFRSRPEPTIIPVPATACVVCAEDGTNLKTFLREFVPVVMLPVALDIIAARCAAAIRRS